jgi:hypothetical protein
LTLRNKPFWETVMGQTLHKGQRLRPLRPALAEREWGVARDSVLTVLCSYRLLAGPVGAADRVDVKFANGATIWGAPAAEFAPIAERAGGVRNESRGAKP